MKTISKTAIFLTIIAVLLYGICSSTALCAQKGKNQLGKNDSIHSGEIVARVNDTNIYRVELDRALRFMLSQNQSKANLSAEQKKTVELAVLNQLVSAELLFQEGRKRNIVNVDDRITAQLNQSKSRFPSTADYNKALADNGLTESTVKEFARKEIYINNLIEQEIANNVTVTDEEIKKFYDENTDKFIQTESVKARHILIGVDANSGTEERTAARSKAEKLLTELRSGADFPTLAQANSTCPSAAQGGDLGYFGKGQMVPEFEKAAFSLEPGQISDVIETQFGYHIIKVDEKKPAGTVTYSEAHDKIGSHLKLQKIQKAINEYIERLRQTAKVEILAR